MDDIAPPTLRGRVGEHFRFVDGAGRGVDMRLRDVIERGSPAAGSLLAIFTADGEHGFEQGLHTVQHDALLATELFVVPSSPTEMCVTFTWQAPVDEKAAPR
jgi:hypothetical protein